MPSLPNSIGTPGEAHELSNRHPEKQQRDDELYNGNDWVVRELPDRSEAEPEGGNQKHRGSGPSPCGHGLFLLNA